MNARARWAAIGAAGALLLALPVMARGLRWPSLQWDPAPAREQARGPGYTVDAVGATYSRREGDLLVFRAYSPEPILDVTGGNTGSQVRLRLENLHVEASDGGWVSLEGSGSCRTYEYAIADGFQQRIAPQLPARARWRVVALGDTGAEEELDAFLVRAAELQADFILHLGDLAYTPGGVEKAAAKIRASKLPVFTAIGNHDFHDGSHLLHRPFVRGIGPRNSYFALGGVNFLNLDTAADTWPPSGGERGDLLEAFTHAGFDPASTLLVFTHRPLVDPRPDAVAAGEAHDLGRKAESEWLRAQILALGADLLVHGHIHTSLESELDGIPVRIAGGGLGLDLNGSPDPEPKLLIVEWDSGPTPRLEARWESLSSPR
jgi:predicted phosphodiesterase